MKFEKKTNITTIIIIIIIAKKIFFEINLNAGPKRLAECTSHEVAET
jgi:hypothetical protein